MPLLGQIFRQDLFDDPGTIPGFVPRRTSEAGDVGYARNLLHIPVYGELRMIGLVCHDRGT
jgi:hypothetical protein